MAHYNICYTFKGVEIDFECETRAEVAREADAIKLGGGVIESITYVRDGSTIPEPLCIEFLDEHE